MAPAKKSKSQGGTIGPSDPQSVINALTTYWHEANLNRQGGPNPRDAKWRENLDLYWGRYDFSDKEAWQSKEVMPEVSSFVDRFSAAMKEALVSMPEAFYTVVDPTDTEGDLTPALKKMLDVWLSKVGTSSMGQPLAFPSVFEDQMKLGAIMACCATVTWKKDIPGGRVAIDAQDPRMVWLDTQGRNLYRIRRFEKDLHDLKELVTAKDSAGDPIFQHDQVSALISSMQLEDQARKEELGGEGKSVNSQRAPIVLDEYVSTILGPDGKPMFEGKNHLTVIANNKFMVRGPEKNPFWHGQDWLVYAPMIPTPLSIYGKAYMEDFASVAKTFNELTNLLLDAIYTSSMKAFVMIPSILLDPKQAQTGIHPNKIFFLDEGGVTAEQFAHALDLGTLPAEAINFWQAMKNELREAAGMNEVGLGQFAPNSRTSATEITETKQSSSAIIRSVAQTVETRFLDPVLDLSWKTGLQFMSPDDGAMQRAAGAELYGAIYSRRKELIVRPYTFQARGISTMLQKSAKLKAILGLMQVIASNEGLMQAFMQVADMGRLLALIFELSDIDLRKLQTSTREALMRKVSEPINAAAGEEGGSPAAASPNGRAEAQDVARLMGVARGG